MTMQWSLHQPVTAVVRLYATIVVFAEDSLLVVSVTGELKVWDLSSSINSIQVGLWNFFPPFLFMDIFKITGIVHAYF